MAEEGIVEQTLKLALREQENRLSQCRDRITRVKNELESELAAQKRIEAKVTEISDAIQHLGVSRG